MSKTILKVIVGSRAHGLAREDSDIDYRGVFIEPTVRFLGLEGKPKETKRLEGDTEDDTAWEIGHFLKMASHSNPTVLEVFVAPVSDMTEEGKALRDLFPMIWHPLKVYQAFSNYGIRQREKMFHHLDTGNRRARNFACAYLRALYQGTTLLRERWLPIDMRGTIIFDNLIEWKAGNFTKGQVVDVCEEWQIEMLKALQKSENPSYVANAAQDFLLNIRRIHWDG